VLHLMCSRVITTDADGFPVLDDPENGGIERRQVEPSESCCFPSLGMITSIAKCAWL
jgi:hypothetical protein